MVPGGKLRDEIRVVVEAAHLEEAALDEAHEVLDRALLLPAAGRAQLNAEAVVKRHLPERLVPHDARAFPAQRHGLRIVEHGHQHDAAEAGKAGEQAAHQRLDAFVRDQSHVHPARVLEPRGEEVDPFLAPVEIAHLDLAKVVLREFPRHALEAHQWGDGPRTQGAHRLVQRRLRSRVAQPPQAMQDLDGRQLGLTREHVGDSVAIRLDQARPPDAARPRRHDVGGLLDR